ncbi:Hint domain-containing protein [Rhodovulum euryhalinum]|uniref:Hint domain-containing protein n=1 Tax=Rhodovulum euryhalinum TaxID=35805 RepID=A0A4R2K792_9RHOB|nr:Hint domain-containing protein [Rhodovulum euryhalinum]TCO69201.1 Hint domain-containing protein [Rhodovulum euryhalinum]
MVTFTTIDTEFAAATGDNVNSNAGGAGTSTFDYPPNGTKDLVITSKEGDPDPYTFEVGDIYEVSFGGAHSAVLTDAVVIRSDEISFASGHAVVFEGTDENGDLVQVVWSPGFDLEQWYWDHFEGGVSPGFYVYDTDPNSEYSAPVICFEAETLIATPRGPVRAASLAPGMMVETVDHGPQMLLWVGQSVTRGTGQMAPVEFPPGAIGNDRTLVLSQQHRVLHASPMAMLMFDTSEVLVPARSHAMLGVAGAAIVERPVVRYVHLLFERHELVWANGAICESLFLGDVARRALDSEARDEIATHFPELDLSVKGDDPFEPVRPILRSYEARALLGPLRGAAGATPSGSALASRDMCKLAAL